MIRRFKEHDRHKALILSLRAGGVGLNLQDASYVFHLDRWWNPAVERQAEDRAHRLGQQFPVTVYQYVCTSTIEERIDRLISEKQSLFDDLIDDVSLDIGSMLTRSEIFGLFGLEPPLAQQRVRHPSYPTLVARCSSFLNAHGWEVVDPPVRRGRFEVLGCRHIDALGFVQALQIWCTDGGGEITTDDVRLVLAHAAALKNEVALAFTADISTDASVLAMQSKFRVWNSKTIARFDHLPER